MEENKDTTYQMLREYETSHVCARCEASLETIWDDARQLYQLVCAKDRAHAGVKRILSDTTLLKRGELDTQQRPGTQADISKQLARKPRESPLMAAKDVATGQALTSEQTRGMIDFARAVGLLAYLGHVCLYFGQPYITIDGYYYRKNSQGLRFAVIALPMTPEERALYQVTEGSHAFIARAMTAGGDEIGRGIGIVTPEEMNERSAKRPDHFAAPIVHDKPQRMAEKRAEWQLMKKMVSLGADVPVAAAEPKVKVENPEQAAEDAKSLWD